MTMQSCTPNVPADLNVDAAMVVSSRNEQETIRLYILISALRLFNSTIR